MTNILIFNIHLKNKIKVFKQSKINSLQKRTMLSRIVKKAATPLANEIQTSKYSSYIVKDSVPSQDKSSSGHKAIVKTECAQSDCSEKNCTNDTTNCDKDSTTAAVVGHLTQSPKNVEEDKIVVELQDHIGPRGVPVSAVIYKSKESLDEKEVYDDYNHKSTMAVQKNENTEALNKHTKNLPEYKENDENE